MSLFAMSVSLEECVICMMNTVHTRCKFHDCCHLREVRTGEINPTLILFSSEACFLLRGYVNAAGNLFSGHKAPVREVTVCVCCAMSTTMITGLIFFPATTNSHQYVTRTSLFQHLSDYNATCAHLQQGSATAYTADNSTPYLGVVCSHRIMWKRLWPPQSPHLNQCDRFLHVGFVKG